MIRNKIRKSKIAIQINLVRNLFIEHGIDINLLGAGVTLYASLAKAKERTKTRQDYVKKGIKFNFNKRDRLALLEVIQGDNEFWQEWIEQHKIFENSGLEADRPTIHRLNPDGNYEFGNIGVLPYGEHQQEHAKPVIVLDTDTGKLTTHRSQKAFQGAENVSKYRVEKMNKAFRDDEIAVQRKQQARKELADRNKEFSKSLT